MAERHILAMGGGWLDPEPRALDELAFGLTGKERPRVCYLPTAGGDAELSTLRFYASLGGRAETSHLNLFDREVDDLRSFLLGHDVIYVGGGNTANALAVWRVHGVDARRVPSGIRGRRRRRAAFRRDGARGGRLLAAGCAGLPRRAGLGDADRG